MTLRKATRIKADLRSLVQWEMKQPSFSWRWAGHGVVFVYRDTPGLLRTGRGVRVWLRWQAAVVLPPLYPIVAPLVTLRPAGAAGAPFHPNVLPHPPYAVCYGQHMPVLLLDELARRIEQILILQPRTIMPDERDALSPAACAYVRQLVQRGLAPLEAETALPAYETVRHRVRRTPE